MPFAGGWVASGGRLAVRVVNWRDRVFGEY